ncbi:MAG TPA: alcohol dehydrogenase [Burkholderiaceae bacterium]
MLSYQVEEFGKPLARAMRERPLPQGTEVVLKVDCCGVCHSDVHLQDGYFDMGGGKRVDMSRSMRLPHTLGHEIAGVVVAVGPDARGVKEGDRRVVFPWIGCGECAQCASGNEHLCAAPRAIGAHRDGGFAEHVLVPHPRVLLEFDPLPQEQACTLACAGLTAYSALRKAAPLGENDRLLIIGAGGVGLSAIRLAREMFDTAPIVAEVDASKWETARDAGAGELIDPAADGAQRALVKSTGGGVRVAIDFVGTGASFEFGFGALRKGGRLVCVGLLGGSASIVPMMVSMKAVQVIGSYVGSLEEMRELLEIARSGRLPPMPVTDYPLAQANVALDDLRAGRVRGRAILKP